MDGSKDKPADMENRDVNELRPAGIGSDEDIGTIVSGMPAGGPDDLATNAHALAESDDPDAQAQLDPFGQGMDAYGSGIARGAAPYAAGSAEADRWLEGWEHQRNAEGAA